MKHGTRNGYNNHGCRCDECRKANWEWVRLNRQKRNAKLAESDVPHGKRSTYVNWGCRCEPCTKANTEVCTPIVRAWRARQSV